jgi:hypothetical protein
MEDTGYLIVILAALFANFRNDIVKDLEVEQLRAALRRSCQVRRDLG